MTTTTYPVAGLTCEHCANAVTSELAGLDGVTDVTVALVPGGISLVSVTGGAPLPEASVTAALAEAGDYQISGEPELASS
jgi:copper chaperone